MTCEIVGRDLDAFVDRELDAESSGTVREHLNGCAACRRRVAELEALGRLVRSARDHSAPKRLRTAVTDRTVNAARLLRSLWSLAAAAVLMASVATGVTVMRSTGSRGDALLDAAIDGHVRSLMAEHLFDVRSTDQHTVKPWFLGKLDFSPPVVDLASIGFPLVGGRLDYLAGRPVAALVYQRQKHMINVFVAPEGERELGATDVQSKRGFHVRHWTRDQMSFWAVSDLNNIELTEFARALQQATP